MILSFAEGMRCYGTAHALAGFWTKRHVDFINRLRVLPWCERKGMGTAVVQELLEYAQQHDVRTVVLQVLPENKVARHIFEKLGFKYTVIDHHLSSEGLLTMFHGNEADVPNIPTEGMAICWSAIDVPRPWWIGFSQRGAGYKDAGPFVSDDEANTYASETGLDRDDPKYEVWQED